MQLCVPFTIRNIPANLFNANYFINQYLFIFYNQALITILNQFTQTFLPW